MLLLLFNNAITYPPFSAAASLAPLVTGFPPQYIVGNFVELIATFTDEEDNLVNPGTVMVEVMTPDEEVAIYTATRSSPGVYSYNFLTTQEGFHQYRFVGSGIIQAACEGNFSAQSAFTSGA